MAVKPSPRASKTAAPARWAVLLGALWLAGCGPSPPFEIVAVTEMGAIEFDESIRGRDGGYSALWDQQSVWVFGDTALAPARPGAPGWLNSSGARTRNLEPERRFGPFEEYSSPDGEPIPLLPLTADEARYNANQEPPACLADCGPKWVLWPGPLLAPPDSGPALLFYSKLRDWEAAGQSLAVWRDWQAQPERPAVSPDSLEPTLLFPAGDAHIGSAAFVSGGRIYAYGCDHKGWWRFPCAVARVRFEDAFDRAAWEFYVGAGEWSRDWRRARPVMTANSILSVFYNDHAERYLALYVEPPDGRIALRWAEAPEGPWSNAVIIHTAVPHEGDHWIYDAIAHPELSGGDSRTIYFSYSRELAPFRSEMRLVRVEFAVE